MGFDNPPGMPRKASKTLNSFANYHGNHVMSFPGLAARIRQDWMNLPLEEKEKYTRIDREDRAKYPDSVVFITTYLPKTKVKASNPGLTLKAKSHAPVKVEPVATVTTQRASSALSSPANMKIPRSKL
ncbi:hypothetical protein BGX27_010204 [Mortierella sp. AM989]|nr:hypothetical protein BGX27_010204 [Mortierella sp. AM989]